jgi:tetratricopeptide (TPR) repeat protein
MPFVRKSGSKQTLPTTNVRKIFVGRTDEILFFLEHILEPEEPTYHIVSISGNGGVGKTTLIKRLIDEAQSPKWKDCSLVGLVDERQSTVAHIMERFADQLSEGGYALTEFEKALIRHRETLHRLWSEREAGQDASLHEAVDLVGSVAEDLVPGGKILHKGANIALDLYTKEIRSRQMRKDAGWLENPIRELTQKFVDGLNGLCDTMTLGPNRVKRRLRILLFFDTFEQLATLAAPWLLDHLLPADIDPNVVLVIAGRDSLEYSTPDDPKRWLEYRDNGDIHFINLDTFTEEETQAYLAERAISDQEQIERIWHLSGGLPLYLSLLTFNPQGTVDPTADVVANFLRWLPEQEQIKRQLVLMAALFSRPFNQDDLAAFPFIPEQEQAASYRWLIRLPFMRSNQLDGRYSYYKFVRDLFSLYLYQQSPKEYFGTRSILASHYRQLLENMQAVEEKAIPYSALKLDIALALVQQLFLLADEASHLSATEWILSAYNHMEQAGEFTRVLRELSQERPNNLASADTRRLAKALLEYIEADQSSEDEQARGVLSDLLEKIAHRPSCPSSLLARMYRERGIIHQNLDLYQQALADLDRAIELEPQVSRAYAFRGSAYSHLKKYQQALVDFDRAIELNPSSLRAHISRGNAYYMLRDYARAIADYSRAIELDPKLVGPYVNRGNTYYGMKDYPRALADYNHVIELDPTYAGAYQNRGIVYDQIKDYQQALADYNHAIELDPKPVGSYVNRGNTYNQIKDYQRALADYSHVIELDPTYVGAYVNRGHVYDQIKEYQQAIADFDRAVEIDPEYVRAYTYRGDSYRHLKEYQRAIADYTRAIELDARDADIYHRRGRTYRQLKHYQQAIADYTRAIELDPRDADIYYRRGSAYRQLKDSQQAIVDLNYALELNPRSDYAYFCRALVHRDLKNYQQALGDLNRALDLDPHYADTYLIRGKTYLSLQNMEQARTDFLRAQELDSRSIEISWMVEWIGMFQEGLHTTLAERLERIAEIDPTHYCAYVCQGITLWLNKRLPEAVAQLEQAIITEPEEWDAYYWKGMIFISLKRDEEAITELQKALEVQLPVVLLRHFAWSALERPDFYQKYVVSLLNRNEASG